MKRFQLFAFSVLFLFSGIINAQYYNTGQDPSSIRWKQIQTSHFQVIYPGDFSAMAQKYAGLLEESYAKVSPLYPSCRVKVPVIIHNYSMESNGYVSWAPRRMELFPLPGEKNLPMDPAEQLTIHETTHVLQMSSLNSGLSRVLSVIFGEQAFALSAIMIPDWAFEGDAVYVETALTSSGRGRSNAFIQEARAMALAPEGKYHYDKLLLGSYKDFTPDHYVFGYLMMNQLRSQNPEAWRKTIKKIGSTLTDMDSGLKKNAGISEEDLYQEAFATAMEKWYSPDIPGKKYEVLNILDENDYKNHFCPYRIDSSRIISLKKSLSAPTAFVITDSENGSEHLLTTTGYIYPYIFSYSNGTVVWAELTPHPRWDNLDYSVIKILYLSDGIVKQLTSGTRYTAPDLSPDGKTIVAVSATTDFKYSLVFINAHDGHKTLEIKVPENLIIQRPEWSSDGKSVTVVTLSSDGEGIRTCHLQEENWEINKSEAAIDIIQARIISDTLFFLAQGNGSDNIYRLSPDNNISLVTESRFGISGFSVSGDEILISDYNSNGFNISPVMKTSIVVDSPEEFSALPDIAIPISTALKTSDTTDQVFISKPYRKAAHLFNFHSWFPFYVNMDDLLSDYAYVYPGVTLLSQNHLSTLTSTVGYEYSNNGHFFHSSLKWYGWFPVIGADITFGGRQTISKPREASEQPSDISSGMNLSLSVSQPLYFANGKFSQLIMPAIYINYQNDYTYLNASQGFDEGLVKTTGRLYFSNIFMYAYRDIYPRWGQIIDMSYTNAPWDKDICGELKYVRGNIFLPGIVRNHSLVLKAGYEVQTPYKIHRYYNLNPYPRGLNEEMVSDRLFSFSADYTMPIFYPDFSMGRFLYLKRVRGSLFYDMSTAFNLQHPGGSSYNRTDLSSTGSELLIDFFLFRLPIEISAGARGGYFISENRWFAGPALSMNIYGTTLGRNR